MRFTYAASSLCENTTAPGDRRSTPSENAGKSAVPFRSVAPITGSVNVVGAYL